MEQLEKHLKQQVFWTRVCALLLVVLVAVCAIPVITLLPQLDEAIANIEIITLQLSQIDWGTLSSNVDALVKSGTESLGEINIDELNKAVQDLRTAISPLVKLFGGAQ